MVTERVKDAHACRERYLCAWGPVSQINAQKYALDYGRSRIVYTKEFFEGTTYALVLYLVQCQLESLIHFTQKLIK